MPIHTQLLGGKTEFLQLTYDHIDRNWKHREFRQLAYDHTKLRYESTDMLLYLTKITALTSGNRESR